MSGPTTNTGQLLDVRAVSRSFWTGGLLSRRRIDAVRDVSFTLTADKLRSSRSSANPAAANPPSPA